MEDFRVGHPSESSKLLCFEGEQIGHGTFFESEFSFLRKNKGILFFDRPQEKKPNKESGVFGLRALRAALFARSSARCLVSVEPERAARRITSQLVGRRHSSCQAWGSMGCTEVWKSDV